MGSEKQNEANRLNAQRSSGPRSSEGKRRSSLNALKHGLFARIHILPSESEADFQNLEKSLREELKPESVLQEFYFSKIAETLWRLRRLEMVEAGIFQSILSSTQYDVLKAMVQAEAIRQPETHLTQFENTLGLSTVAAAPQSTTHEKVLTQMSEISQDGRETAVTLGRQIGLEPGVGVDRIIRYERHLMTMLNQLLSFYQKSKQTWVMARDFHYIPQEILLNGYID